MRAGERTSLITLERMTPTTDIHGGEAEAWALYAQEWAHVLYGTGRERREAAQERASQTATFRVPSNPFTRAVNPAGYRIQFNQFLWDVVGSVPLGRDGVEITAVSSMEVIVFSPIAGISALSSVTGTLTVAVTVQLQGGVVASATAEAVLTLIPLGPELIDNGDMSNSTNWTFSNPGGLGVAEISGGKLRLSDDGRGLQPTATRAVTLTDGATYRVRFTVDAIASGGIDVTVGGSINAATITTTGAKEFDVVAGAGDFVDFTTQFDGTGIVIDDLSLKLLS